MHLEICAAEQLAHVSAVRTPEDVLDQYVREESRVLAHRALDAEQPPNASKVP
jgi:hypothetical protein